MQIVFDSRFDGVADARRLRAMLDAYLSFDDSPTRVNYVGNTTRAPLKNEPVVVTQGFTPGDLSGSAPSAADAAPAQSAPEVSTAGVPAPPSVASVPAPPDIAPEALATPSSPAPTVDSSGLPWDKRIHSSSKAVNADGTWRKLRGLNDAALVARVEAELRAAAANPGNTALAQDAAKLAGMGVDPMTAQPLVPPPPTVAATPAVPPPPGALTHEQFMEWITPRMMDGRVTFDMVASALQASNVESLKALEGVPGSVAAVYAALGGE